ncbi:MAG: tRNA pseudouridine(13) synthase TruD [Candidatus Micrarchaeia archaeon]
MPIYLSKHEGTGGKIKETPESFVVEEILSNGAVLMPNRHYQAEDLGLVPAPSSKFTTFVLQKRNWNTVQALIAIAKRLQRGKKSISYAGTKDRVAITVQLASIYGIKPEELERVKIKDISINGAWLGQRVELGSNIGNRFEVRISQCKRPENAEKVLQELEGRVANYFDKQRFGMRGNNAEIGLLIIKGELEEAAMKFLSDIGGERNENAREARRELAETGDFKRALENFPKYLKPERQMLAYLAKFGKDYANAFRRLPRGILIMFIHAVQSLIFNTELEERISAGDFSSEIYAPSSPLGFPDMLNLSNSGEFPVSNIVGYGTEKLNDYENKILEKLGITKEDFKIKWMPELSMKGSFRPLIIKAIGIELGQIGSDVELKFSLPAGSYATVFLREITKEESDAYES